MLLIAHADSIVTIATGVCAAGLGAAIAPAIYVELIPIALQSSWRNGAISAINAGATPGIVMTGLIGLWFGDAWRDAWLFFAGTAIAATLWNVVYRSEEHTSELQSLMRISYAVFCLNKKKKQQNKYDQI